MNRRTVLQSAGVFATVGLAGCVGGIREHFEGEIRSPIPIEIYNESDQTQYIQLEARERGTGRGTYDQSYSVTPGERVSAPSLEGIEQSLQAVLVDQDEGDDRVEVGAVTPETVLVSITIYEDDLDLQISSSADDGNASTEGNESVESDGNETDSNESS
ncbi:hypothetical protein [Halostagnicola kamekurae]|uniref:Uncharacterized protein n=1 Tax=Halostagnicola kamekurae TaxID=619731 RepID=A0A1I6QIQ2_9EURY|nr:hypothetical protein [Halostagnicola kamekurae]SFS52336.1 hypothetical protein SAMN04488556_1301 [Halostagnicola kamekurae]